MRPKYEVADVLQLYGTVYFEKHQLSYQKRKVLRAITNCRTAALGGHLQKCNHCDYEQIAYNSCRNRHCPKCQVQQREKWIKARIEQTLPIKYFHVVFTMPSELNRLCLHYPKQLYNTLFYAAWQTLKVFSKDKKYLDAKGGMTSILHTWGQNLSLHPHLHCMVPSGGINDQGAWKNTRSKGKYLFPVRAMSIVYRAIFLKRIKKLAKKEAIEPDKLQELVDVLFNKPWVVYCKRPFKGVENVIEYLGRYSHKIAISNHRIKSIKEGKVAFSYKNYRHNKMGIITLEAAEFIRRFCQHILPKGFVRIRHFGILAARNKKLLDRVKQQLLKKQKAQLTPVIYPDWKLESINCPKCKKGKLENYRLLAPIRAGPIISNKSK